MILPDLNLLVYAYNEDAPAHGMAKAWWVKCLSGDELVALPWAVLLGFVRLMTSRSVLKQPLAFDEAIGHIRSWLDRPQTRTLHRDLAPEIFGDLSAVPSLQRKLTTDAHLAALAIELHCELHTNDGDFAVWPRWTNP